MENVAVLVLQADHREFARKAMSKRPDGVKNGADEHSVGNVHGTPELRETSGFFSSDNEQAIRRAGVIDGEEKPSLASLVPHGQLAPEIKIGMGRNAMRSVVVGAFFKFPTHPI
jgi:hypothetical protein